jgi:hypothetical protein
MLIKTHLALLKKLKRRTIYRRSYKIKRAGPISSIAFSSGSDEAAPYARADPRTLRHVYSDLTISHLDALLSFELADTLSGNIYRVDRNRLACRVGAIASRAIELILHKESEKWRAQSSRKAQEI